MGWSEWKSFGSDFTNITEVGSILYNHTDTSYKELTYSPTYSGQMLIQGVFHAGGGNMIYKLIDISGCEVIKELTQSTPTWNGNNPIESRSWFCEVTQGVPITIKVTPPDPNYGRAYSDIKFYSI